MKYMVGLDDGNMLQIAQEKIAVVTYVIAWLNNDDATADVVIRKWTKKDE